MTKEEYKTVIKRLLKDMDESCVDLQIYYGDAQGELKSAVIEAGYGYIYEEN